MIWIILLSVILIISVIGIVCAVNNLGFFEKILYDAGEAIMSISTVTGILSAFILIIMVCVIISSHCVGVDVEVQRTRLQYESLQKRLEVISGEYEDVSRSDVIKDVTEWNSNVIRDNYYANNPWTNWFYNKEVLAEEKYIDISEVIK